MSTDLLGSIAENLKQKEGVAAQRYFQLVQDIANGAEETETDAAEAILKDIGKSVSDLRADVNQRRNRAALQSQLVDAAEISAERTILHAQINEANAELKAAQARHVAATAPLAGRLRELNELLTRSASAKAELYRSCTDPELHLRSRLNSGRLNDLDRQLRAIRNDFQRQEAALGLERSRRPRGDEELSRLGRMIERSQAAIAELEASMAELVREQKEIYTLMVMS